MKERPILFSGEMVRAILEGRKTQTRRMVKSVPCHCGEWIPEEQSATTPEGFQTTGHSGLWWCECCTSEVSACPYGASGDQLWVRESWKADHAWDDVKPSEILEGEPILYAADEHATGIVPFAWGKGRPSIFMPRWASRITLEIVSVRVERLQDISESDAIAEGIESSHGGWKSYEVIQEGPHKGQPHPHSVVPSWKATTSFRELWDSINYDKAPWSSNPWLWVVEFNTI